MFALTMPCDCSVYLSVRAMVQNKFSEWMHQCFASKINEKPKMLTESPLERKMHDHLCSESGWMVFWSVAMKRLIVFETQKTHYSLAIVYWLIHFEPNVSREIRKSESRKIKRNVMRKWRHEEMSFAMISCVLISREIWWLREQLNLKLEDVESSNYEFAGLYICFHTHSELSQPKMYWNFIMKSVHLIIVCTSRLFSILHLNSDFGVRSRMLMLWYPVIYFPLINSIHASNLF